VSNSNVFQYPIEIFTDTTPLIYPSALCSNKELSCSARLALLGTYQSDKKTPEVYLMVCE
jgi:hypothetical protein